MHRSARSLLRSISLYSSSSSRSSNRILPAIPDRSISTFRLSTRDSTLTPPLVHLAGSRRNFGGIGEETADHNKEVDEINLKFAEAREEIEAALESKETVYFNEEAECTREAVKVVLDLFGGLLAKVPEKDRMALQRSMGLKIEQLKAELQQLDEQAWKMVNEQQYLVRH